MRKAPFIFLAMLVYAVWSASGGIAQQRPTPTPTWYIFPTAFPAGVPTFIPTPLFKARPGRGENGPVWPIAEMTPPPSPKPTPTWTPVATFSPSATPTEPPPHFPMASPEPSLEPPASELR